MNGKNEYHVPVLLQESIDGLTIKPDGVYLDGTVGGGGHFQQIVQRLHTEGTAIGIDRDRAAIEWVSGTIKNEKVKIILERSKFSEFDEVLQKHGIVKVDGILLDLGVSSYQLDQKQRGFTYKDNAPLDMRMNIDDQRTAAELIKKASHEELTAILSKYGEIRNAGRMAHAIERFLKKDTILTSDALKRCFEQEYGKELSYKVLSKVFQAFRIAVNNELDELHIFLEKSSDHLVSGGRLVVISYHSLEDRIVKQFFHRAENPCTCAPHIPYCRCRKRPLMKRITKKVCRPSPREIETNPRARSARLRIAEKIT